ncbi:glycosyltransferase family 2 protein [Desulfogranum mediterraneum]|uniref:glycosyltransferase family 2 protein n=1 Tax=Desulfogranum mediterraneum TaxID=160661 RepID=UPI00048FCC9F|nr:glycosyltransferase family 2 protein [Desulfogranum mediterraneum]
MPLVSIIVPMYNAERFVQQALSSIIQEQSVSLEIIVVNDKSTDNSLSKVTAVDDPRIRIIDGPGKGIAACFNAGLAASRGEIIMRCDADDIYPHDRIRHQVRWLDDHADYGALCGGFTAIDPKGQHLSILTEKRQPEEISAELNQGITRTHFCTFAVRASTLKELKMREFFTTAEDIDLQLRLAEKCRIWFESKVYYHYRLHDLSITHSQPNAERIFFEHTAREFQEQRQKFGSDDLEKGVPPSPTQENGNENDTTQAASHIQRILLGEAWRKHAEGKKLESIKIGYRSLRSKPSSMKTWKSFFALLLK